MKKKLLSVLIALTMCFMAVPAMLASARKDTAVAFASELPTVPFSGEGSVEEPFLISSASDLFAMAQFVNEGSAADYDADAQAGGSGVAGNFYGYYFKQTANIDLTGIEWEPIGYSGSYYFAGNYDGGNYTVSNATSTGKVDADGYASAGIFGWVAFGSVKNLHIKNANFLATSNGAYSYVGGLVGVAYGSVISNCSVMNSTLESRRMPRNNNCCGSIAGYSTGGTFEKCAAQNNTVKAQAYAGGFVGEVDDDPDYGAGTSSFTDCCVAECSVTAYTPNVQDTNVAGGFAGEITDSVLTVKNCYVYNTEIAIDAQSVASPKCTGVLAGNLWGTSSIIEDTNCYYDDCGEITDNVGTASIMTDEQFTDGTVTALLGSAFIGENTFPLLASLPADYTKVDEAISLAATLDGAIYETTAVDAAVAAVVRGKMIENQAEVDEMAKVIEDAIAEWQRKAEIATLQKAIDEAHKNLNDAKLELESAINGKASASELQAAIHNLDAAYKEADALINGALAELVADDEEISASITALGNELTTVKSELEEAIVQLQKKLDDAKAGLEAKDNELAQKDKELNDRITVLIVILSIVGVISVGGVVIGVLTLTKKRQE